MEKQEFAAAAERAAKASGHPVSFEAAFTARPRLATARYRLANGLKRLGYQVYPSHTNFILARQPDRNLKPVYEELKRRKILVRYFDVPGLRDCLRITVGTPKEVRALLNELATIPA